ncbi:hypothetical protein DSL64_15840 [Dyadobacter luteus]|uniref:Uncharacterized protein n=1 Tax=Dyadobacter luteus TaxID=2259619 RepID=A0A3D8Y9J9_9BACT|nr:hypothetical protein DSL64_15840 [Dyadobacter luteus]
MRSFIAYLLLFAVMLPTLSPWGTIAYFNVNRAYIAKTLCENRSRPELKCNGKCYLAKILKKQEAKKDKETTQRVENMPVAQLFYLSTIAFVFDNEQPVIAEPLSFFFLLSVYNSPCNGILRPPQLV